MDFVGNVARSDYIGMNRVFIFHLNKCLRIAQLAVGIETRHQNQVVVEILTANVVYFGGHKQGGIAFHYGQLLAPGAVVVVVVVGVFYYEVKLRIIVGIFLKPAVVGACVFNVHVAVIIKGGAESIIIESHDCKVLRVIESQKQNWKGG